MKTIFASLIVLVLFVCAFAQESAPTDFGQSQGRLEHPITQADIEKLPRRKQTPKANSQPTIREEQQGAAVAMKAPAQSLVMVREFITYIFREAPDLTGDKAKQQLWLTEHLRKGLAQRQEVYRKYKAGEPDSPEQPPSNHDFVGAWDNPTAYTMLGSRRYQDTTLVDVEYRWGKGTNYAGDKRLATFVLRLEGGAWKLDDIYMFNGKFAAASSLSNQMWSETY